MSFCFIAVCWARVLEILLGASLVLDRVYIELIGTGICVVTVFDLGMNGVLCFSQPKAGIPHLGPTNLVKHLET